MSNFPISSVGLPSSIDAPSLGPSKPVESGGANFSAILGDAIQQVNDLQTLAGDQVEQAMTGEIKDIHSAMIAVQKADVSFQMMMQVRNKIVSAYQEIMKMQV